MNGKNLSYNRNLPPFLAALQGHAAEQTGPDPILAARRRPAKKRSESEEAEDAPLVLDEQGELVKGVTIGLDGKATMFRPEPELSSKPDNVEPITASENSGQQKVNIAEIGAGRKRKVGKLVGVEEDDNAAIDVRTGDQTPKNKSERTRTTMDHNTKGRMNDKQESNGDPGNRVKKKPRKKIALSFESED